MYGDRGAFGGQFGGIDPSLVEQIYNYVQPSPFASSAMRDPSLLGQTSEMMTRLAYPDDKLAPPTRVDVSMPTGQSEHDALDVIGAIFKAPFRLIGAAKNGLEEAIGHPNADRRAMQDEFMRQRELAILASNSVSPQEKAMLFPDAYAQDRQAIAMAQTGGDATATGRDTSNFPLPAPRKVGIDAWFFGDEQKQRSQQMARVKAFEALIAQKEQEAQERYKREQLRGAQIANEKGQWDLTQGYAYDDTDRLLGQEEKRTNIDQGKASIASLYAGINNMGLDNTRADSADLRAQRAADLAEEEHRLAMRKGREDLRSSKLSNRQKLHEMIYGKAPKEGVTYGYNTEGQPFNLNEYLDNRKGAADPALIDRAYKVPMKKVPTLGGFGPSYDAPDEEAMRRAPTRPGLIVADENHPRYTEFYNRARTANPGASESEVKQYAREALQHTLDSGQ